MRKTYKIEALATSLGASFIGDGSYEVTHLVPPTHYKDKAGLVLAMEPAFLALVAEKEVQAVVVREGAELPACVRAAIMVARPRVAMARLNAFFEEKTIVPAGIHPSAVIEHGAIIGEDVAIGAMVYVGEGAHIGDGCILHPQSYVGPHVVLGDDCELYSGVRIGARVRVGARAIIHFNASIGADGFSFVTPEKGSVEMAKETGGLGDVSNIALLRIASLGAVELGDDVEVGANSSIDRGTIVSTRIGNGTKIDNQVQIGHNVEIGENCMLCGRVGIAGSVKIGNRVVLGGAAGVADHVTIGDDTVCMGMSGVAGDLPPRSLVGGFPAKPRKKLIEDMFNLRRVKSLARKVDELSKRVEQI